MTREAPRHLFVYGTLMRGSRSPYAKLLQARARFVGEAFTQGKLYNLGRFPGAVFDPKCRAKIYGEIFRLNGLSLLDLLDAYEGCRAQDPLPQLFCREIIEASPAGGGTLSAWSYPFKGDVAGRAVIASGRFPSR
jgi:gamma-glutamylcyclotransferase (GGCT)/AIG2-like uncharacterized protein YtfP